MIKFSLFTLTLNIWFLPIQDKAIFTISSPGPRLIFSASEVASFSSVKDFTSSESTDKIYRLPPPGGTMVPDEIKLALRVSFLITKYLLKISITKILSIDVVLDIDFDTIVGRNKSTFQQLVYYQLSKKFHPSGFEVRNLFVQKGSVKISYEVGRAEGPQNTTANCNFQTNLLRNFKKQYRACRSKLFPMSSISATNPNHESDNKVLSSEKDLSIQRVRQLKKRAVPNTKTSMRFSAYFTLDVNYPEVAAGREDDFKNHLIRQLARQIRIPLSSIQDFNIQTGMKVSFVLVATDDSNNVMDERTVIEAADDLQARLKNKQLRFTDLEGRQLTITNDRLYISHEQPSSLSVAVLIVLISVLILMLIFVVLAGFSVKTTRAAFNPSSGVGTGRMKRSRKSKAYRHIATQDTGRESTMSLGRYSYDSGLWLGPGPEPIYTVPEAPYYRPPTVQQLSSTPRPATSLRTRLKKHWNIDPDQTLPPIPDGVESSWDENARHHQQHHRRHSRDNNRFQQAPVPENETYS